MLETFHWWTFFFSTGCSRVALRVLRELLRLFSLYKFNVIVSGKKGGKKLITNWTQADSSCVLYCEDCDRPCYLSAVSAHGACVNHAVLPPNGWWMEARPQTPPPTCCQPPRNINSCRQIARSTRENVFTGVCNCFVLQALLLLLIDLYTFLIERVGRI